MNRREVLGLGAAVVVASACAPAHASIIDRRRCPVPITAIVVRNRSTVQGLDLVGMVTAIQRQLNEHVGPLWRIVPPVLYVETGPAEAAEVVLLDDSDAPGALAYHSENSNGEPFGRVFVNTILKYNSSVSVSLSHEILEMVGDASINMWGEAGDGYQFALEMCDAVEADTYTIGGQEVSNFILPAWFDFASPIGARIDYMYRLDRPFTLSQGGYVIRRSPTGEVENVFSAGYPQWKREMKLKGRGYRRAG